MKDDEIVFVMFVCMICVLLGAYGGMFAARFMIPSMTMKIWDSPRSYDHILVIDDVVCKPINDLNASYYHYETLVFNKTEYIASKTQVSNATVRTLMYCSGGKAYNGSARS